MRVSGLKIKNFLGLREYELAPGAKATIIRGRNASGKTSLMTALQSALGGGSIAKLKNVKGDDDPELVLVFDDGAARVEKDVDGVSVKTRVGDTAAYQDERRPQSWLDKLVDPEMSNPLRFLNAKAENRVAILLESLKLELDRVRVAEALGPVGIKAVGEVRLASPGHPLVVLSDLRGVVFNERTGVNRSAKEKRSAAEQLYQKLPAKLPESLAAEVKAADEARSAAQRAVDEQASKSRERTAAGDSEFKLYAAKRRKTLAEAIAEATAALTKAAEEEIGAERDRISASMNVDLDAIDADAAEVEATLTIATENLATLREQEKNLAALRNSREIADRFNAEAEELEERSIALSYAIQNLDDYKRSLAKNLPIAGLEVIEKDILVDGVPFDQVNTARKIKIAVQVATLRVREELPVVFVDGAEALDAEQFEILMGELAALDVQVFVARVEDTDLAVESRS